MSIRPIFIFFGLGAMLALGGCNDSDLPIELPGPVAMNEDAMGHYCSMNILEHNGPKAQIHLKNVMHPIWFSQVRDAIAFTRLPEETYEPVVIYVHDMSRAVSWEAPGDKAWIKIDDAFFVIGSKMIGGMGAPEAIPFGTRVAASDFAADKGGKVMKITQIPDDYVLGPVEINPQNTGSLQ